MAAVATLQFFPLDSMPDTFFAENQTVEKPIKTYQSRKKSRQAPVDGSVDDSQIWLEEIEVRV